jgi:hypothetical protein
MTGPARRWPPQPLGGRDGAMQLGSADEAVKFAWPAPPRRGFRSGIALRTALEFSAPSANYQNGDRFRISDPRGASGCTFSASLPGDGDWSGTPSAVSRRLANPTRLGRLALGQFENRRENRPPLESRAAGDRTTMVTPFKRTNVTVTSRKSNASSFGCRAGRRSRRAWNVDA